MNASRTRPGGWSLGPPDAPGRYWYSESRETPAELVAVTWLAAADVPRGSSGSAPQLGFRSQQGGPVRLTERCTGWWRADTESARLHDGG